MVDNFGIDEVLFEFLDFVVLFAFFWYDLLFFLVLDVFHAEVSIIIKLINKLLINKDCCEKWQWSGWSGWSHSKHTEWYFILGKIDFDQSFGVALFKVIIEIVRNIHLKMLLVQWNSTKYNV